MCKAFLQILIILTIVAFAACNKDGKNVQVPNAGQAPPTGTSNERYVYIACEGSFGSGNASLSMHDVTSLTTYDNAYLSANNKSLGDVFQSIERIGNELFLCINNSDKVLVVDADTREFIDNIDIPQPRYILPINENKAYVSALYGNKVFVINPSTRKVTGTIELNAQNPESMAIQGSKAYVTTWDKGSNKVYLINTINDTVLDSFRVAGYAPHDVVVDASGFVWVLSGNPQNGIKAALTKLPQGSAGIVDSFIFDDLQDPIKLRLNAAGDVMYFIGVDYNGNTSYNGIYEMSVTDSKLPAVPLIAAQKFEYFWGLGIDPITDDIYVGNPKGFTQKGAVTVYNKDGEQKRVFNVGVGPGYFYFDK